MRALCWIWPHNYVDGFDDTTRICIRCDKIIPKPKEPPRLPPGTRWCPYPECGKWIAMPSYKVAREKDRKVVYVAAVNTKCKHCDGVVRWTRETWNHEWNSPIITDETKAHELVWS